MTQLSEQTQKEVWTRVRQLSDNNISMMLMSAIKAASADYHYTSEKHEDNWLLDEAEKIMSKIDFWLGEIKYNEKPAQQPFYNYAKKNTPF